MAKTKKKPIATSKPEKIKKKVVKPVTATKVKPKPKAKPVPKPIPKAKPKPKPKPALAPKPKPALPPKPKPIHVSKPIPKKKEPVKVQKTEVKKKVTKVPEKQVPKGKPVTSDEKLEVSIDKKLVALYSLQQIDSQIDRIRIIRGELPLEVQDLEDEIAGLETRIENYIQETVNLEKAITEKKNAIKDSHSLIKKYGDQQMNVRNNREYDSLTKEIEYQNLEIQLSEKRIREFQQSLELKKLEIEKYQKTLQDRNNDLDIKKNELDDIVAETEKEESTLIRKSEQNRKVIEDRLLTAYTRIRKNARNGLAVVQIERDACGGCFNKIPPQHQLDIRMHKKIIVCEYCGRILVDDGIAARFN
jgi:predicted  nucleic acid-binding Zn-ribbon protein